MSTENALSSGSHLTKKEVAARLRVCTRTIEREIAAERFPRPLKIRRRSFFMENDLVAYVQKLRGERERLPSP